MSEVSLYCKSSPPFGAECVWEKRWFGTDTTTNDGLLRETLVCYRNVGLLRGVYERNISLTNMATVYSLP